MVATLEASPKNISALATAAVSLNEKARALDRIRALNVEIGPKWIHLSNLQYQLNAPEEARKSYFRRWTPTVLWMRLSQRGRTKERLWYCFIVDLRTSSRMHCNPFAYVILVAELF